MLLLCNLLFHIFDYFSMELYLLLCYGEFAFILPVVLWLRREAGEENFMMVRPTNIENGSCVTEGQLKEHSLFYNGLPRI